MEPEDILEIPSTVLVPSDVDPAPLVAQGWVYVETDEDGNGVYRRFEKP